MSEHHHLSKLGGVVNHAPKPMASSGRLAAVSPGERRPSSAPPTVPTSLLRGLAFGIPLSLILWLPLLLASYWLWTVGL